MRYRFIISDYYGESHDNEFRFASDDAALLAASSLVTNTCFIRSVICYRLLANDSCGPIEYMDSFEYE